MRALAKTRADLPNELDLEHVAEEIEDMGRSEINGVRSHIRNIMIHIVKAASDPDARSLPRWAAEARAFHRDLNDRITPAMRARLDLPGLWRQAVKAASADLADYGQSPPPGVPIDCPFEPGDFTGPDLDFRGLVARLIA